MRRRSDIFVSICISGGSVPGGGYHEFHELARALSERYRYWEILIGVPADRVGPYDDLIAQIPSARLVTIRPSTPFYRSRVALASEAIGDVVVLTSQRELQCVDLMDIVAKAQDMQCVVIGRSHKYGFLNPALVALGRSAGFLADGRDMLTAGFPRTALNQLLSHPDRQIALRYPPADGSISVVWQGAIKEVPKRSVRDLSRRVSLINALMIGTAPNVLYVLSVVSVVLFLCSLIFGFYATTVFVFVKDIQPGWFTTSAFQSMIGAFLSASVFGLSLGMQRIIEVLTDDITDDIVGERTSADMFSYAFGQLNVEINDASDGGIGEK